MKIISFMMLPALLACGLISCNKSELETGPVPGEICVKVSDSGLGTDGSGTLTKALPMDWPGGETVYLLESVEVADTLSFGTKGTIINTSNLGTSSGYADFGLEGYIADNDAHHVNGGIVSKSSGSWVLRDSGGDVYNWVTDKDFVFWGYAPRTLFAPDSFSKDGYTLSGYTVPSSVTSQQDIIAACSKMNSGSGMTPVNVSFGHAMSVIRFKLNLEGCTLKSASLSDVMSKGDLDISQTGGAVIFNWSNLSNPTTFSQTFASDDFTDNVQKDSGNKLFFMIPQNTSGSSKVTVSITVDKTSDHSSITKTVQIDVDWKAGNIYTYSLSYDAHTFDYVFSSSQSSLSFSNTNADSGTNSVAVTSTKKRDDETSPSTHGWSIKSYKIGSGAAVTVSDNAFTAGGLAVSKDGSNIKVKALKRTAVGKGSHTNWTTGSTADQWSPADWTESTASSPIDLSKFDFKTETPDAHSATTANCYIIRHAGTYKFPLVYGNGVIDGAVNTDSYAPIIIDGGANGLTPFVNHLDAGITSPFIESNSGCTAASCGIVWQEEDIVIKDVKLTAAETVAGASVRYLQFTVDKDLVCQNNALLAIKDADGNIIWSWHIWVTNDPALLADPIDVYTSDDKMVFKFMPLYFIGYVDALKYPGRDAVMVTLEQAETGKTVSLTVNQPEVNDPAAASTFQFGRKDPMCIKDNPVDGSFYNNVMGGKTIGHSIKNPNTYYKYHGVVYWCTPLYVNLWAGTNGDYAPFNFTGSLKTVYDPSPAGYRIAPQNAYTAFTLETNTSNPSYFNVKDGFSNGWYFYTSHGPGHTVRTSGPTIYFPTIGYRDHGSGIHTGFTTWGESWGNTPSNGAKGGHNLEYGTSRVYASNSSTWHWGFGVRPVVDSPVKVGSSQTVTPYESESLDLEWKN